MARRTWSIVCERTSWSTVAFWIVVRVDRKTTITMVSIAIATTSSTKVKPRSVPSRDAAERSGATGSPARRRRPVHAASQDRAQLESDLQIDRGHAVDRHDVVHRGENAATLESTSVRSEPLGFVWCVPACAAVDPGRRRWSPRRPARRSSRRWSPSRSGC